VTSRRLLNARRAPRCRQAGFTLMELLITMAVTIIGLMGLMSLHIATSRGNDLASRGGEGITIAQQTLEDLRAAGFKDMVFNLTGNRNTALPIDVTLSTTTGRTGMTYRRRVIVTEMTAASTNLVRIRVEIGWTDDNAAQGSDNGVHDHVVALEIIRTRQESL
jgi:prepilin-type N-terminal cleavage/methylation domain-containing protein